MIYSLYVKATDEQEWHLLKDKILQPSYTIDPTTLADGKYVARLVASDEESNPPDLARKSELLSAPFWVDNTPPDVSVLKQTVTGDAAEMEFAAEDDTSPLRSAETSLDGKDWRDDFVRGRHRGFPPGDVYGEADPSQPRRAHRGFACVRHLG